MADEKKTNNTNKKKLITHIDEETGDHRTIIYMDDETDPRLDPNSDQFDVDYFKEVYDQQALNKAVEQFGEVVNNAFSEIGKTVISNFEDTISDIIKNTEEIFAKNLAKPIATVTDSLKERIVSMLPSADELNLFAMWNYAHNAATTLLCSVHGISRDELTAQSKDENGETIPGSLLDEVENYANAFIPLMYEELEKDKYQGKNFLNLLSECAEFEDDTITIKDGSLLEQAVDAVEKRQKALNLQLFAKNKPNLPSVIANKPNHLDFAVDKVNATIWSLFAESNGQTPGQISFANYSNDDLLPIAVEGRADKKKHKERTIYYAIDFNTVENNLTISKRLNAFDRRVYEAIGTLFNANNEIVSISQIYAAMGNTGRPNSNNIAKISDSIDKMASARILLDRTEDYKKYSDDSSLEMKYKGPLLAIERIDATINGQLAEGAIHLFREPVLMTFAREKNQITTIPRPVIETKKRQTENNLEIENYLLERIARMKNSSMPSSNKILYQTIFEKANIKKGKPQQRAIPTILEYLEHYKKTMWIKGYKEVKDGVEIHF